MRRNLESYIKPLIENCVEIIDIKHVDNGINGDYLVRYIKDDCLQNFPPNFHVTSKTMDLRQHVRDYNIDNILGYSGKEEIYDIEDIIYTKEQKAKIDILRNNSKKDNCWEILRQVKKKYSDSFEIGDKVFFKGSPGFITFKHADKFDDQITRWSIKVKDVEYRYVSGTNLAKRKAEKIYYYKIDPELNKLSTEKLLKMFKSRRDRNKGIGDPRIKRILQDREHVQKGPTKIVIC